MIDPSLIQAMPQMIRKVPPVRHDMKFSQPMQPQQPNYPALQNPIHPALLGAMNNAYSPQ